MNNTCVICMESNIINIINLHNINIDHKICFECFNIWYIKNNHSYDCILCKQFIDINSLPNFIKKNRIERKTIL